jgi:hypothetical protein
MQRSVIIQLTDNPDIQLNLDSSIDLYCVFDFLKYLEAELKGGRYNLVVCARVNDQCNHPEG